MTEIDAVDVPEDKLAGNAADDTIDAPQAAETTSDAQNTELPPEQADGRSEARLEVGAEPEGDYEGFAESKDDEDVAEDDEYAVDDEDDEDDDVDVKYMQNRELSWLTFNERVLDQGADESVPLLERLNFISIFWSNLQEFFMVRVGSLTDLSLIEPPVEDSKTGMTPKEQIRAIHERCKELYPIQESYYEHVRGSLAKEGVRHLRPEDLSDEQKNYLFGLVKHNIEPFLSPQIINARHPFPHIENGKLYILVRLDDEVEAAERKKRKKEKGKKKEKGGAEGVLLGLIPLPHQCERVIKLPGRGFQFILLEHAIEMFVPEIFSMYRIKHTNVICVTRNADIDANQGFDEQDEDYREHMKRLLKQRARLAPVRLECERPLSPVMEKLMLKKLDLKRYQVYDTMVPLDLSFTWGLGSRLSDKKRAQLTPKPFAPAWPTCFDKKTRIIDQVQERETLLFYPYESMDPFVQLLREASTDPDVVSIKITLYRLASQSHLAEALIAAADNGKEVTALFELRARFDESNNIIWSQRFEEAGCNVLYGFRDYKVHSKICCITRRTENGLQHITQLGTGNYNEKTAKLYTDLSFITTDERFGKDAVEFFRNMQLENVSDNYKMLRVAPLQIKTLILQKLDEQIDNARKGKPAKAFLKANSVTDVDVIEKISQASNAGVSITLFVRGICCIVPRVKDATENVRVVSIVGRLLEHSRIYCFGTGDECEVYLSSADLMTRNLNKRVEIAWPVLDTDLRDRILMYIDICMHDTAKLREMRANTTYTPLGAFCDLDEEGNAKPAYDAQNALIEQAAEAAEAAEAEEAEREAAAAAEKAEHEAAAEEAKAAEAEREAVEAAEIAAAEEAATLAAAEAEDEPLPEADETATISSEQAHEQALPAKMEEELASAAQVLSEVAPADEQELIPRCAESIANDEADSTTEASERVAELIDQLNNTTDQKPEQLNNRISDFIVEEVIPTTAPVSAADEPPAPEGLEPAPANPAPDAGMETAAVQDGAAEPEAAPAGEAHDEKAAEELSGTAAPSNVAVAPSNNVESAPAPATPSETVERTSAAAVTPAAVENAHYTPSTASGDETPRQEPQAQADGDNAQGAPSASGDPDAVADFFSEEGKREIDIPKKKHRGFFAWFRRN